MAEEWFGRLVLQTDRAVSVFDLYETPHLACKGFYMSDRPQYPVPPSVLREIELVVDKEALDSIQNGWTERIVWGEGPRGVKMTSERFGLDIDAQMNHVVRGPEQERDIWIGQVNGTHQGTTQHFDFMLERVGSPELITLLPAIWLGFFLGRGLYQTVVDNCSNKADAVCGAEKVKSVRSKRRLSSAALLSGNVEDDCEIECA